MMKFVRQTLACLPLVALPLIAHANLVDHGVDTFDTQSGLEWLDLNQTQGLSFDEVSAQLGAGGTYAGYRYATTAEAQNLLGQFGLPIVSYTAYAGSPWASNLASFDALLGLNVHGLGPGYAFEAETGGTHDGYHELFYGYGSAMNTAMNSDPNDAVGAGDRLVSQSTEVTIGYAGAYAERNLSHFLVREGASVTAVPEPGTYALMLAGLAAIGLAGRGRSKRVRGGNSVAL